MLKPLITADVGGLDITVFETSFGFVCRYGLQTSPTYPTLHKAMTGLKGFKACFEHAMAAAGYTDL